MRSSKRAEHDPGGVLIFSTPHWKRYSLCAITYWDFKNACDGEIGRAGHRRSSPKIANRPLPLGFATLRLLLLAHRHPGRTALLPAATTWQAHDQEFPHAATASPYAAWGPPWPPLHYPMQTMNVAIFTVLHD